MKSRRQQLQWSHSTHIGRVRDHNEDQWMAKPDLGLWVVADGMGGHQCGEVASQIVVEAIVEGIAAGTDLSTAIQKAHQAIVKAGRNGRGKPGMGSTAVALLFRGNRYEVAWVGDSRAYIWDGRLRRLTRDHSFVQGLLDAGAISEQEARDHPERSVLSQALGVVDLAEVKVDRVAGQIAAGQMILLCSDGLTSEIDDRKLEDILAGCKNAGECTRRLEAAALSSGGNDNITIVAVAGADTPLAPRRGETVRMAPEAVRQAVDAHQRKKQLTWLITAVALALLLLAGGLLITSNKPRPMISGGGGSGGTVGMQATGGAGSSKTLGTNRQPAETIGPVPSSAQAESTPSSPLEALGVEAPAKPAQNLEDDQIPPPTPDGVSAEPPGDIAATRRKGGTPSPTPDKHEQNIAVATLEITTTPKEARAYIDGQPMSRIEHIHHKTDLKAGKHDLQLIHEHYEPLKETISLKGGTKIRLERALERAYGSLKITSVPPGAKVHIGGALKGKTPLNIEKIEAGYHDVLLTLPDWEDFQAKVLVQREQTYELKAPFSSEVLKMVEGKLQSIEEINSREEDQEYREWMEKAEKALKEGQKDAAIEAYYKALGVRHGDDDAIALMDRAYNLIKVNGKLVTQEELRRIKSGRKNKTFETLLASAQAQISLGDRSGASEAIKLASKTIPAKDLSKKQQGRLARLKKEAEALPENQEILKHAETGLTFVWVSGGCFTMGSNLVPAERPPEEICVNGFWMGQTEATEAQFQKFIEGSKYEKAESRSLAEWIFSKRKKANQPMVNVTHKEAEAMAAWCTTTLGHPCRLPTEAEWEYACRAGTRTIRFWGEHDADAYGFANTYDLTAHEELKKKLEKGKRPHRCQDNHVKAAPVKSFRPNPFGLYDMLGNVSEWCLDGYDAGAYKKHQAGETNPRSETDGPDKVVRGGSWNDLPFQVRCAARASAPAGSKSDKIGFRLIMEKALP